MKIFKVEHAAFSGSFALPSEILDDYVELIENLLRISCADSLDDLNGLSDGNCAGIFYWDKEERVAKINLSRTENFLSSVYEGIIAYCQLTPASTTILNSTTIICEIIVNSTDKTVSADHIESINIEVIDFWDDSVGVHNFTVTRGDIKLEDLSIQHVTL